MPIRVSTKCYYKVSIVCPGKVIVTAKVMTVGRTSFTQVHEVVSTALSAVGSCRKPGATGKNDP